MRKTAYILTATAAAAIIVAISLHAGDVCNKLGLGSVCPIEKMQGEKTSAAGVLTSAEKQSNGDAGCCAIKAQTTTASCPAQANAGASCPCDDAKTCASSSSAANADCEGCSKCPAEKKATATDIHLSSAE